MSEDIIEEIRGKQLFGQKPKNLKELKIVHRAKGKDTDLEPFYLHSFLGEDIQLLWWSQVESLIKSRIKELEETVEHQLSEQSKYLLTEWTLGAKIPDCSKFMIECSHRISELKRLLGDSE